tara:strand:- start:786 stop:1634 length:849 start_codon:yes stop_codon:yes gene_type:complete
MRFPGVPIEELAQLGGYSKEQKLKTDSKGLRVYVVYTLVGTEKIPHFRNNDEDLGMQQFRGKSPKEVAKKVVTEICQMVKRTDPSGYKKYCKAVSQDEVEKRNQELLDIENLAVRDPKKADSQVNWNNYPGFQFILEDTMNTTSDGTPKTTRYYGERIKLDVPKKYKGNKFNYESQVIPIRKDYELVQALIDHIYKSKKATKRYKKTQNFAKYRKRSTSRKKTVHNKIMKMTISEIKRKCGKSKNSWKVEEINDILTGLALVKTGSKEDKCKRLVAYRRENE